MILEYAQLFLGTFGLTLSVSYLIWCRVRITVVRQELFEVRDRLWDEARDIGALNDPAYLYARDRLNDAIVLAYRLSLPALIAAMIRQSESPRTEVPKSDNQALQAAIEGAQRMAARHIARSVVIYRPFTGVLVLLTVGTMGIVVERIYWLLSQPFGSGGNHGRLAHA
ncbi:MAG: hypothetical protein RIC11_10180 [Botrimarina sp.]